VEVLLYVRLSVVLGFGWFIAARLRGNDVLLDKKLGAMNWPTRFECHARRTKLVL
jgi:hypothetical protein